MDKKDINALWTKVQAGDLKAFESLFHELYPGLCYFAQKILNNLSDSEEVTQDAFIHLWLNRSNLVLEVSIKAYLYQSVHNLSINKIAQYRTRKFQTNTTVDEKQWKQIHDLYIVEDTDIQMFESLGFRQQIREVVDSLPQKCKEIFLMSRLENLTYKEIAEKLNLSQNTVKVQIFRALEIIKTCFEKNNY
ncbi:MAG: RNA polymerase sigma-70 factor [Bacteroidota bacterium]|nr:RNA polymerase sigma-70 factor [Bacteroidota bacterium]MDP4225382.1 RNA polymerase sigma-70 factor [Bacteroidota bacterium]MDP4273474.1 RNA polymerase sigma-70 factor [Bacteroidota bacterium]